MILTKIYCIAVPGEPYPIENDLPPSPVPAPSVTSISGMVGFYTSY